eukprot:6181840-Pleurochrysis_carterae.AAC.7
MKQAERASAGAAKGVSFRQKFSRVERIRPAWVEKGRGDEEGRVLAWQKVFEVGAVTHEMIEQSMSQTRMCLRAYLQAQRRCFRMSSRKRKLRTPTGCLKSTKKAVIHSSEVLTKQ